MSDENREDSSTSSEGIEKNEVVPGYVSMEHFIKDGFKTLTEAIRHSNALPTGRDWNFYNVLESFPKIINDEGNNILRLMNQIIRSNEIESNIRNRILDEKTELVVEANDVILEKVANNIDEMNGIRKSIPEPVVIQTVSAQLPVNGSWNRISNTTVTVNSATQQAPALNCIKLITAKNIVRPQKFFKDKIDNSNKYPWYPRITEKPNSLKPLAIFLEEYENKQEYSHPYECELDRFAPTTEQLLEEIPALPRALPETPLIEIDKPEQLDDLVETLRSCKEFAVDLEHHSYRSFMGITCLMQISTIDKDYLIDTLALRDKLSILNEVFTKNTIVKIFHGADKDIEWLQRDLSIYVVNMFDTHQAAKFLQYSGLSLAFLMKKYCNILPNKQFQLADWRIRPLPEEFKSYAREDTHYLIYIYKMLKKELLLKGKGSDHLLKSVIDRSTEVCKRRYFKPVLQDDSHLDIYRRCKKMFDNRQLYALKEIYAWRDNLAREEDESLGYVLPNHMLLQISEALPREMQGILACCNPVPPLVRSHLLELHHIVLKAREQPLEKAILKDHTSGRGVLKNVSKVNVDSALHCPHDLSKTSEFRDDLPTLLNNNDFRTENRNVAEVDLTIEKRSSYPIFEDSSNRGDVFNETRTFKKMRDFAYFSPYERYKLIKPFVEAEEKVIEAKIEEIASKVNEEQLENNMKDSRTDDERIASVRDHFMQLSKKFNEELEARKQDEEAKKSLIEMGGSRKRKRDFESTNDPKDEIVEISVHTPTPRPPIYGGYQINNKNKKRGKKRKFNEAAFSSEHFRLSELHQQGSDDRSEQQQSKKKKKNKQQQQKQEQQQNQQQNNQNVQKKKRKKGQNQNEKQQNFVPYDYASVNFRQFQGGAGSATSTMNIKSNFKAKGRRKIGNKGARYSTFNNVNRQQGKGYGR